jgi:toxin FitB
MKYLLDTNVISELIARRPNQAVLDWLDALDPNTVYLSVITIGEIKRGIEKLPDSNRQRELREWLEDQLLVRFAGHILAVDTAVMLTWGELTAELDRRDGRYPPWIRSLPPWLAATAVRWSRATKKIFKIRTFRSSTPGLNSA